MRKIKFRGLTDEHVWVYGWFTDDDLSPDIIDGMSTRHKVLSKTVGQFTGYRDRDGVEIYEDDILQYGSCVEVVFYEPTMGRFMTKLKKCNDESEIGEISSLSPYYTDNYKVIGNIFENLEFLK